jgi:antitoxin MazE
MRTRIRKWGNSLALRIPKRIADELDLSADADVQVEVVDNKLQVTKAAARLDAYDLDDLLAGVTQENRHDEVDWGPAVGLEASTG